MLTTSWITVVEIRRNLGRLVTGTALITAQTQFSADLDSFALVICDEAIAKAAANIGEALGVRSLDAIHLASAQRLQVEGLTFVTFDVRQAQAARSLGFVVRGA